MRQTFLVLKVCRQMCDKPSFTHSGLPRKGGGCMVMNMFTCTLMHGSSKTPSGGLYHIDLGEYGHKRQPMYCMQLPECVDFGKVDFGKSAGAVPTLPPWAVQMSFIHGRSESG